MLPKEIKKLIEDKLTNCVANITSHDNVHFEAYITSDDFINKNRLQSQQLVYDILNKYILDGSIHAISLKTQPPAKK